MHNKRLRRLPVLDEDKLLVGIITMDDILDTLVEMLTYIASIIKIQQKKKEKRR
ncbi:CBS domain-containing protein [Legionella gresilensis]|uniref:CBS domain-containing protein n=1 Tax=Legionella gresilensis TaxID=91823 RepID=UPI001041B3F2|nr:CBS domain-containing protein [Legionella gresilensis]